MLRLNHNHTGLQHMNGFSFRLRLNHKARGKETKVILIKITSFINVNFNFKGSSDMNESTDELKESNNQIIKEHSKDESDEGFL